MRTNTNRRDVTSKKAAKLARPVATKSRTRTKASLKKPVDRVTLSKGAQTKSSSPKVNFGVWNVSDKNKVHASGSGQIELKEGKLKSSADVGGSTEKNVGYKKNFKSNVGPLKRELSVEGNANVKSGVRFQHKADVDLHEMNVDVENKFHAKTKAKVRGQVSQTQKLGNLKTTRKVFAEGSAGGETKAENKLKMTDKELKMKVHNKTSVKADVKVGNESTLETPLGKVKSGGSLSAEAYANVQNVAEFESTPSTLGGKFGAGGGGGLQLKAEKKVEFQTKNGGLFSTTVDVGGGPSAGGNISGDFFRTDDETNIGLQIDGMFLFGFGLNLKAKVKDRDIAETVVAPAIATTAVTKTAADVTKTVSDTTGSLNQQNRRLQRTLNTMDQVSTGNVIADSIIDVSKKGNEVVGGVIQKIDNKAKTTNSVVSAVSNTLETVTDLTTDNLEKAITKTAKDQVKKINRDYQTVKRILNKSSRRASTSVVGHGVNAITNLARFLR